MSNPKITPKERNLLKGAVRRVFSRSELHNTVIKKAAVVHADPKRPRVKSWVLCNVCKKPEAKSYVVVDHIDPVVPLNKKFESMSFDYFLERMWCDESNLQAICPVCHKEKSKVEMKERRKNKPKKRKQYGR